MVEKHEIMFEILHELNMFDPIRNPQTSDIMLILLSMFFSCPHNYYNDYIIITTIMQNYVHNLLVDIKSYKRALKI